jgi:hypothetical protein
MLSRFSSKGLLIAVVLGAVVLAIGLLPRGAGADPCSGENCRVVDTLATVTGGGSPPIINAKWETVDMTRYPAGVFDYFNGGYADDDPATPGLQFAPWLGNDPEERKFRIWTAVEDPNGALDVNLVWTNVYHPDGSIKFDQLHMAWLPCDAVGYFDDSGPSTIVTLYGPLLAAVDTQQLTQAEAEEVVTRCYKGEKTIWVVEASISKEQPSGDYTVEVYASDYAGEVSRPRVNSFNVISVVGLVIDFKLVNWGEIKPGFPDVVSGDADMRTSDKPTVKNIGNDPMYIWLHFTKMIGRQWNKEIWQFDAQHQGEVLFFNASEVKGFCHPLYSNDQKQLDVSIEPPVQLPRDVYTGLLHVFGSHEQDPRCD